MKFKETFKETLIQGITAEKVCKIFEKYATEDRIYTLWSQFLNEHNKLMRGKGNNAYSCIRATLVLLSLADKDIDLYDVVNSVNYTTKSDGVELLKLYSKSLIEIKEKNLLCNAFKNICFIAYKTLERDPEIGNGFLAKFKFDIFEDFKTVLLAEELDYYQVVKEELLNAMLYCDEFNEVHNYDTSDILEIMEDVVDDSPIDFQKYDDYIATELHEEAHRFLDDYLAECTIPFRHDTLTEDNYEVLVIRLARLIKRNSFVWLMEHVELEDGYYKVDREKMYKGYVGTVLFKGVYYDFDTESNDIVVRQGNIKEEFSVSGEVIDIISDYYEAEYKN